MKHDSLYIIMPAYNEEKNIGTVIEQWYPVAVSYTHLTLPTNSLV